MPKPVSLRDENAADDATLVVRGAPVDAASLRRDCDIMARRFAHDGKPLWGFSVEGVTADWPLERVLQEGRVRSRLAYATCSVQELRVLGCEVLATFGSDPPHYTVCVPDDDALRGVSRLLARRTTPNPKWSR